MSVAPVRVVPPGYGHLAGDPNAPYTVVFAAADEKPSQLAAAFGLRSGTAEGAVHVLASRTELEELAAALVSEGDGAGNHLRHFLEPETAWKLRTRELPLDRVHVMGILNLTDDSFSGDGVGVSLDEALRRADALREAGADIIDVGAESARADRPVADEASEADLMGQTVAALAGEGHVVSADTYKGPVARAALEAGAEIVNDISGLTLGGDAAEEAARAGAGYVLNYSYSVPKRRPDAPPDYGDVVAETLGWMVERVEGIEAGGMPRASIAIDPGIAFGKSHDEDLQVLRRIGELRTPGLPLLLAHSRKNFIASVNGRPPADRDPETHAITALAAAQGVRIFRVHDPEGTRRAVTMAAALSNGTAGAFAPDGESWPWRAGADGGHMTRGEPEHDAPQGQRW